MIYYNLQPRSETPPSLARTPGMGFFGSWCMDASTCRQERVGRTYGEIHRTDSFGPDISKYKYTGQEEDRESGLYYYKARYYDPVIGRFTQNDSMAFPDRIQGMNRMMYVEGNPMSFVDDCGTNAVISSINKFLKGAIRSSNQFFKGGIRSGNQFLEGMHRSSNQFSKGGIASLNEFNKGGVKSLNQFVRNAGHSLDDARREIGRAIDGGVRWLQSGGQYSRNGGNNIRSIYDKARNKRYMDYLEEPETEAGWAKYRRPGYFKDRKNIKLKKRIKNASEATIILIISIQACERFCGREISLPSNPPPGSCNDVGVCTGNEGNTCTSEELLPNGNCPNSTF